MRQIKFRAWDRDRLTMEIWVLHDGQLLYPINEWEQHYKQESQLMQFTGIKDKNAKEICEGNIVKFGKTLMEVIWNPPHCQFEFRQNPWNERHHVNDACEVIGNIYENPELLSPKPAKRR